MIRGLNGFLTRASQYRGRYGWRHFFSRLLRFWLWLPPLLASRVRHQPGTSSRDLPFGVNVIGYISGLGSFGEVARLTAESLQSAGVPVALIDLTLPDVPDRHDVSLPLQTTNPYRINLLITPQSLTSPEMAGSLGSGYLARRINVGIWAWEYQQVPEGWHDHYSAYDEVWVPSTFIQQAASTSPIPPVVAMPHPVRSRVLPGVPSSALAVIPPGATVFLFVFNYNNSSYARKNLEGLIEAFRRAFSPSDTAWLVIKSEFRAGRRVQRALAALADGLNILLLDSWMSRDEIDALVAGCDCYVSLHRAEGFGLTMAEAMAFAKPVIATAYSGNLDFMTPENSYLVNQHLIHLGPDYEGNGVRAEWLWADPDLDQAAAYMRHVHEQPDEARALGLRARDDVQATLSLEAIGLRMKQRLLELDAAAVKEPSD